MTKAEKKEMLGILKGVKKQFLLERKVKAVVYLCNAYDRCENYKSKNTFKKYLINNFPEEKECFELACLSDFKRSDYVVFLNNAVRHRWLLDNINKLKN